VQVAAAHGINGSFLEIGCGDGRDFAYIRASGQFADMACIELNPATDDPHRMVGDFLCHEFNQRYDAILCSHVLEHSPNPGQFLAKIHELLNEGGILCINVPPLKHAITAGHLTLWNPGLLLLNLVRSGFDCKHAKIRVKGYNIAVVLVKRSCGDSFGFDPASPTSDRRFLPDGLSWFQKSSNGVHYFKGNFKRLNWGGND
jgi:SAM-dependent methyltransferase